jgi:Tol biopolymer transport system component
MAASRKNNREETNMRALTSIARKLIVRDSGPDWRRQRQRVLVLFLVLALGAPIPLAAATAFAATASTAATDAAATNAATENPVENWSQLAYASFRDGNFEIYTARGDGTQETQLTFRSASDSTPKLNRGATRIVFASTAAGLPEIYTINVDGSGETRLTFTGKGEYLPAWSPDGTKIAFTSLRDGNYEIYVMNADGSAQTRLTNNTVWDAHPAWSPDGKQIAFVSNRAAANKYQLWTMNADGSNPTVVSAALNYALYPAWSPDSNRLAFNDDENNDGTLDVAIINRDGTGLTHPLGTAPKNTDYRAPTWSPDGQQIAFSMIHRTGATTWDQAQLYALNLATNNLRQMTPGNQEWWVDWQTTDVTPPTSSVTAPALAANPVFPVSWSGTDAQSGVKTYDVQVRDGPGGSWVPWMTATTQTAAVFSGELAHTYYFQARARDWAGNVEAYPGGNGSAMTATPQYVMRGQVLGSRDQPVAVAQVQAEPPVLGPALSDARGGFKLYYNVTGTTTLTVSRTGFGLLPPMGQVAVNETAPQPTLYLPPLNDAVTNGQFESGDLSGWNATGEVTPIMTTTAHTGLYGAQLGDTASQAMPVHSVISQTMMLPDSIPASSPATLSLLYRAAGVNPVSTTLTVNVYGSAEGLTMTLPLTSTEWQHVWWDIPASFAPTVTVSIDLSTTDPTAGRAVAVDEVSLGTAVVGSYPVFLPVITH